MSIAFHKVEGLGNDFLLLDRRGEERASVEADLPRLAELAPQLCDRRRGVGGDGLLVVGPPRSEAAHATMWVINFDGSRPEMCGNGLRCVAHGVAGEHSRAVAIDTDDGLKRCEVEITAPHAAQVLVDMGPGRDAGLIEVTAAQHPTRSVSMGNPHAIAFVDHEDPEQLARELGPAIEVDPAFPHRTNVEFARLDGPEAMTLWVWERGVGITEACGTGACATACAAVWSDRSPAGVPLAVDLPGGRLWITVPREVSQGVLMKGPSRIVFEGRV